LKSFIRVLAQAWCDLPSYGLGFFWCWMILRGWSLPAELVGVAGYTASLLVYSLVDALVRG
jgi:hypothetical protein